MSSRIGGTAVCVVRARGARRRSRLAACGRSATGTAGTRTVRRRVLAEAGRLEEHGPTDTPERTPRSGEALARRRAANGSRAHARRLCDSLLRFDIPMNDVVRMAPLDRLAELEDVSRHELGLKPIGLILEHLEQILLDILKDEILCAPMRAPKGASGRDGSTKCAHPRE